MTGPIRLEENGPTLVEAIRHYGWRLKDGWTGSSYVYDNRNDFLKRGTIEQIWNWLKENGLYPLCDVPKENLPQPKYKSEVPNPITYAFEL